MCDYGRAARYGVTGQHAGQRKCQKKATTTVSKREGRWLYWYCDEHALAIAPTAPQECFDGPINIERTRNEAMQTAKSEGSDKERQGA